MDMWRFQPDKIFLKEAIDYRYSAKTSAGVLEPYRGSAMTASLVLCVLAVVGLTLASLSEVNEYSFGTVVAIQAASKPLDGKDKHVVVTIRFPRDRKIAIHQGMPMRLNLTDGADAVHIQTRTESPIFPGSACDEPGNERHDGDLQQQTAPILWPAVVSVQALGPLANYTTRTIRGTAQIVAARKPLLKVLFRSLNPPASRLEKR